MTTEQKHDVLVIGGGNGGMSAAAWLRRRGCPDVGLVEPSEVHVYKPLQNYVATGLAPAGSLAREQASLVPDGVRWHRAAAVHVDPERRRVLLDDGSALRYGDLLLAPGARIDWDRLPGAAEALEGGIAVTAFHERHLARTDERLRALREGRAVFTLHEQPASGRETALKPLLIACDRWRASGALGDIEVVLVHDGEALHPVPEIAAEIARHLDGYGVRVLLRTRVAAIEAGAVVLEGPEGRRTERAELVHLLPPYAAPELAAASGLDAPGTDGFLAVDAETLRHPAHERIWCVGDAADLGDARTGGALRHQVRIAVENIRRSRAGIPLVRYDGYTVAPIATARRSLSFGEYDRALRLRSSIPLLDGLRSSPLWYLLDRYALPQLYWHGILKGRA